MKKILILSLLFLFSCGNNEAILEDSNTWKEEQVEQTWAIIKNTTTIISNIKNICDKAIKWKNFEEFKKENWVPKLLSQNSDITSYYYGDFSNETCSVFVHSGEIIEKNYINI